MESASREQNVPLNILYSVALTETGRGGRLQPYDINADGKFMHGRDLREALELVAAEQARGAKFIDVGCMQINIRFHGSRFGSLRDMFDPSQNVRYAASFLKILKAEQGTWTLAVARYNAGPNNDGAQKKYVCSVIANMVSAGLGAWTDTAREFCK